MARGSRSDVILLCISALANAGLKGSHWEAEWRVRLAISWSEMVGEEGTLLMLSNMRHAELRPVPSRGIRLEAKFCTNRKWSRIT